MTRLLLVRHAATEDAGSLRFLGRSDVPLSGLGMEQAERLRDRLARERIDAAYSSDLGRAAATAALICEGHRVHPVACSELREIDFGECEGLTFADIARCYPRLAQELAEARPEVAFPGGETFGQLAERAGEFLRRLEGHPAEETVLVVSHGGVLRLLLCRLLGLSPAHWWQFHLDRASLSVVESHRQGSVLVLWNDTSHLRPSEADSSQEAA